MTIAQSPRCKHTANLAGHGLNEHVEPQGGKTWLTEFAPDIMSKIEQAISVSRALSDIEVGSNQGYQNRV